jgi:hypothetical protein
MCGIIEQQGKLLKSRLTVSSMSVEEVERYTYRNDRLRQLCQELTELP